MSHDILVVRFSSIGDLILTTPLLRAIKSRHPLARITFVVRSDMADTIRHNPRIDKLITWDHRTPMAPLARELRKIPFTHRLDLQGSLRSRRLRLMVGGHWSGFPKHLVRRSLLIATRRRHGGHLGAVADRYFEAARGLEVMPDGGPAEFFTSAQAERQADAFLAEHNLGNSRRLVALAPGAAHATKRWPEQQWEALSRQLLDRSDLIVLGGPGDQRIGERLEAVGGGRIVSAAGKFPLLTSGALLKRARVLASGDTGLMHLATAVGTPVVALFGPGVEEFGFFPYNAAATVIQRDLPCRPCTAHGSDRCPLGHHECLRGITPATVAEALERPPR